tara:strand:+ start:45 stop:353 length:309 start_codon:yes stop_codon:yes gene_type:complete
MIDKSETPCPIRKKHSPSPMTVPTTKPSPNDIAILIDVTKQYAYILSSAGGTIRRSRVAHHELEQYEKVNTSLQQAINKFKHKALSLSAFNELKKLEKKINA